MTPIQQLMLGVGAKKKTYMEDVFSTQVYTGNGSYPRTINSGINFASEGGMVWIKTRSNAYGHQILDTARGLTKSLESNGAYAEQDGLYAKLSSWNSNGYTMIAPSDADVQNGNNKDIANWNFRKAPGFFDVVTYTGTGSTRTVAHNLGCVPGLIMIKCTSNAESWIVYHREVGAEKYLILNNSDAAGTSSSAWNNTAPTSTHFTVSTAGQSNDNGYTYVAYLFAGGESTAATARSVNFASNAYLSIPDHVYPGDGDNNGNWTFWSNPFTIEMWVKCPDAHAGYESLIGQWSGSQRNFSVRYSSANVGSNWAFHWSDTGSNNNTVDGGAKIDDNQWHHIAVVRTGGNPNLFKLYTDGKLTGQSSSHSNTALHNSTADLRIGSDGDNNEFAGQISNLRIIRNIAHYTSDFKVPTAPLPDTGQSGSNVSGTVLLCCNNSSVTGSSFTSGTITAHNSPTASTDSPFDDPAAFTFGENEDQGIIKCGSYTGNGSSTGPEINLGWEPQWLLIKRSSDTEDWMLFDSMRGIVSGGNDHDLRPNASGAESTGENWLDLTSNGFKIKSTYNHLNDNGNTYIYTAIRRPDGYVGKPADAGTDVFAMDTGGSSDTIPNYDSGFPVDFAFYTGPGFTYNWYLSSRLISEKYLFTDTTAAEATSSNLTFDSNAGWSKDGHDSGIQSWMWKRHAGFDVVAYTGDAVIGRVVMHNLSKSPEMIWIKKRDAAESWTVGHKGLNGGTNPWEYYLQLESTVAEADYPLFNDQAPSSTSFQIHSNDMVNGDDHPYIAMLFASVDGISKVGYFDGSSSDVTITTGFTPRFIIIKTTTHAQNWATFDTLRGLGSSGNDQLIKLNSDAAQGAANTDYLTTTATGFVAKAGQSGETNGGSSYKYIYYAHA